MKPTNHRILFNIDANVWMYMYRPPSAFYRPKGQRLSAKDIHRYVDVLADGGIDTLCVNGHSTQLAYYPSKVVPTCTDGYRRGDRSFFFGHLLGYDMTREQIESWLADSAHYMDAYLDLIEEGTDWFAETAKACRRRGISPFIAMRMNDTHGASKLPEFNHMNSELYKKHPEFRLRGVSHNPQAPPENSLCGFSYEHKEVRDHVFAAIRDMVENYDYEGLQLEWNRNPMCCEPGAAQDKIDLVTEFHAEIRRLTEKQGKKIGKHFTVGLKYIGTLEQNRSIGLDIKEIARRGLIDYVSPTNFWQSSWDLPLDDLKRELPGTAVYGAIEIAPNWLQGWIPTQPKGNRSLGAKDAVNYRLTPYCPPMLRGNAAAKLVLGADGVEVYNFPCADQISHWAWEEEPGHAQYPALRKLDNLEWLRGQEKLYTQSSQTGYYLIRPFESPAAFPSVLMPGETRDLRIPMAAEPANDKLEFVIQIVLEKKDNLPPVGVSFNGSWPRFDGQVDDRLLFAVANMTHHTPDHTALTFRFPLSSIREGWNDFTVLHGKDKAFWGPDQSGEAVTVVALEAAVRAR